MNHGARGFVTSANGRRGRPPQRRPGGEGLEDGYTEREQRAEALRDSRRPHRTRLGLLDFEPMLDDPEDPYAS